MTDGGNCNIPDAFLKKRGDNKPMKCTTSFTGFIFISSDIAKSQVMVHFTFC